MPENKLQLITLAFLKEHFYLGDGSFEPVREDAGMGNLRYGWSHYKVSNVEVALLTDDAINSRFVSQYRLAASFGDVGTESCYMELFGPHFHISMVVVLTPRSRPSRMHPGVSIQAGADARIECFKFAGEIRSAFAHFTFAKLAQ